MNKQQAMRQWSTQVLERDNRTCQFCGSHKRLVAHHAHPRDEFPELLLVLENGLTLCRGCHAEYHHRGKQVSEDTRRKLSAAGMCHIVTEPTRELLRAASLGVSRPFTDLHRQRISDAKRGHAVPDEVKKKISETLKERNREQRCNSQI